MAELETLDEKNMSVPRLIPYCCQIKKNARYVFVQHRHFFKIISLVFFLYIQNTSIFFLTLKSYIQKNKTFPLDVNPVSSVSPCFCASTST